MKRLAKIISHGLLVNLLNEFSERGKFHPIPQTKNETATRKLIDCYYHIKDIKVVIS